MVDELGKTLLHKACDQVCATKQPKNALKLVLSLLRAKYPVYLTDKEGKMPISYLLKCNVSDETLIEVLKWHLQCHNFNVFKIPIQRSGLGEKIET